MSLFEESLKRIRQEFCDECKESFRDKGLGEEAMAITVCSGCYVPVFTEFMVDQASGVAMHFMPKPKESLQKEVSIKHSCTHTVRTIVVGDNDMEVARRIRELTLERCLDCTMKGGQ